MNELNKLYLLTGSWLVGIIIVAVVTETRQVRCSLDHVTGLMDESFLRVSTESMMH